MIIEVAKPPVGSMVHIDLECRLYQFECKNEIGIHIITVNSFGVWS